MHRGLKEQFIVAFCWAIIINSAHMSVIVYNLPRELSTLLFPAVAGAYMGLRFGLKKGLVSVVLYLIITAALLYLLMSMPSRLGIIDPEFIPLFDLIIGFKVIRSIILVSLFSVIFEIVASIGTELLGFKA